MIVVLSGITGVGKSYLKKCMIEKMNFKNIVIVTTRAMRKNEVNGIDKFFVTDEQFESMKRSGEISVPFEFLGNKYAYYTKDLTDTSENSITELHYSTIDDFRKSAKNIVAIYLKPVNIEMAKEQLKLRNLPPEVEQQRLKEIEEQAIEIEKNNELKEKFDYIIYNDYTKDTEEKIINIIKANMNQDCLS
jgi:guanylate kinase